MGVHRVEQAFYGVLIFSLILLVNGWNEWKYSTRWSETEEASRTHCSPDCDVCTSQADCDKDESCVWQEDMNRCVGATQSNWQIFWGERPAPGFELSPEDAPRPRRGHSMMTFYDKSNSFAYRGATLVFMFGGRDNEAKFEHIPRTYNVAKVNGTVVFTTYRDKPVNACNDIEEKYYTSEERAGCNFTESSRIDVGIFYNDVWAYKMCERSVEPQSTPGYGPLDGSIKAAVDSLLPKVELGSNPSDNVDGTYLDVPIDCVFCTHTHFTSGTPEQARVDVQVSSGSVSSITARTFGSGYQSGDRLYISGSHLGGGSDVTMTLTSENIVLFDRTAALQNASPKRYFDEPCEDGGWLLIHPGAPEGGCVIQLGILVCNVPSERYGHASAMFDDGTFYVYGGFSQRCADYCDDLWLFDIYLKGWRQVYASDSQYNLSKLYYDVYLSYPFEYREDEVPRDTSTAVNAGPSRRWRHAFSVGHKYDDKGLTGDGLEVIDVVKQPMALFGGHRLWQGFTVDNQESNSWSNFDAMPLGGYLDDLWIYTKYLDLITTPGETFKSNDGRWQFIFPKEECFNSPGISWESRFDVSCFTVWPPARAGHGLAFDSPRNGIWIFGGYSTYYPYLKTDGEGSGSGVTQLNKGGFIPYPGFSYWKNDLWFYDIGTGYWTEHVLDPSHNLAWPDGRQDAVFLLLGELLFLHGGFSNNHYYDDTWYYNVTTSKWLEKERFVYPSYPDGCTDDLEYIAKNNCTHLMWPKELERDLYYPFDFLPYSEQQYYWPDSEHGPYWDIKPKDFSTSGQKVLHEDQAAHGTPMFTPEHPYAATGPMQFVKPFTYVFNSTHNGTLYEHCTSVYGEPTRHTTPPDGKAGRAPGPILVPQPRRRRPGWDGCSGRQDGRTDLDASKLTYERPKARAGHAAVWLPETQEIIMYGGMSYKEENAKRIDETWPSITRDDMWYFGLNHCLNNCSDHGVCKNGFCFCYVGYYGEDCSNTSCPGTSCYYDEYTNDQVCVHACQAGYVHTDDDIYVQDVTKIPCSPDRAGEINGVCDGFGKTQCAPPFIGDDCGTKDCKNNCSFNGWCSIEFPVSRCMCQPGYFGETCEFKLCLNNCSYPNGVCDTSSGFCKCRMMYSPYNQTREYHPWGGEDCSWLYAYQGADKGVMSNSMYLASVLIICISLVLAGPSHLLSWGHGLEAVPPEVSTSESVLHDSGS